MRGVGDADVCSFVVVVCVRHGGASGFYYKCDWSFFKACAQGEGVAAGEVADQRTNFASLASAEGWLDNS